MTAYQFGQPWLSHLDGDLASTAKEFAHLRNYLKGLDDGTTSLFNPTLLNATINALTVGGNIAMGGFKLTGLGAGSANGDSLRYEQLIGLYLLLTGGTMSGAIAMGTNKVTGLASAAATGDALSWGQAFTSGTITFSPTTSGVKGTTTNDNTTAGNVGEYVESTFSAVNLFGSGTGGNFTSISLTAGDWDVSLNFTLGHNGATVSVIDISINTTSATNGTIGVNRAEWVPGTGMTVGTGCVVNYRLSLSATTTVYAVGNATYTVATPQGYGRLSARRMR